MTRWRLAATAVFVLPVALGGCAVTSTATSKLDDYQSTAEQLSETLVAEIPADVEPSVFDVESQPEFGETQSAQLNPSDPAWWRVYTVIELPDTPDAAKNAAGAIDSHLQGDGWNFERVREIDGRIADGYRTDVNGESWYVEIRWMTTQPDTAETVNLLVQSPTTTRGDNTERD